MTINEYRLTIIDGYIKGFTNELFKEGILWKGQPSIYEKLVDDEEIGLGSGCYKLVDNEIIYDENKAHQIANQIKAEREEAEKKAAKPEAQLLYTALMTDTLLEDE